jgi:hypothetical protein
MQAFGIRWDVDQVAAITAAVRTYLDRRFGYAPDATHTHAIEVSLTQCTPQGVTCLETWPMSFRATDYTNRTADLEDLIDTEARARLRALRNAQPLMSIAKRSHWL